MSSQVLHRVDLGRGFGVDLSPRGRGRVGVPSEGKSPGPATRPRPRHREPNSSPRKSVPLRPSRVIMLGIVARVGLALLITAGLASALALHAGLAMLSPNMIRACEGIFLWTLALVSSGRCD